MGDVLPAWAMVNAASWRLAAELVAAIPHSVVHETHPCDGQYDVLNVHTPDRRVHLDINRFGSLHTHAAPTKAPPLPAEQLWPTLCRPGGPTRVAVGALERAGLTGHSRNRSRARLTYEVIAQLLISRMLDQAPWDVRSVWRDDPYGDHELWPPPAGLVGGTASDRVWAVLVGYSAYSDSDTRGQHDPRPVAWLWEGWVGYPDGERRDLTRERARGDSLGEIAARVSRPRPEAAPD